MTSIIDTWIAENSDQGHYAAFVGFEKALRGWSDELDALWEEMDIQQSADLFAMVTKLIGPDHHALLRRVVATIEEWYAQDQAEYMGDAQAREAAHREVAVLREIDAVLGVTEHGGG